MKRYDSYKDSGVKWIGKIPLGWETPRLKHSIIDSFGGEVIDKSYWGKGPETLYTTSKKIHKSDYPNFNDERRTTKSDLLLSRNGDGIVHIPDDGCIYTNVVQLVRIKNGVDRRFLWYSLTFQIKPLNSFSDGDFIVSLNKEQWFNLLTPLPPLSEQQQIVSFLDTKTELIDSLISKTEKKIELLKEKRTSLINELVTKGLNTNVEMKDSGVEWIGEIPSHWGKCRIKHLSKTISKGTTPSTVRREIKDEGTIYYIKIDDFDDYSVHTPNKFIDETTHKLLERSSLQENDILVVITGSTTGKTVILPKECIPSNTNQNISFIRLKENKKVKFTWYWLFSEIIQSQVSQMFNVSTLPSLSMEDLGNFQIPQPPISEQQQIVEYLDEQTQKIDKTISIEEKRIELLKEYRQSLISEVVTGKLKVTTDE